MINNRLPLSRIKTKPEFPVDKSNPQAQERFTAEEFSEIKQVVADRIRQAFGGASNAEIARRCLTTNATIKTYTDGDRLPIAELLLQMHRATGVSLDWLLLGKGQKFIIEKVREHFEDEDLERIEDLANLSGRKIPEMIAALAKAQLAGLKVLEKS